MTLAEVLGRLQHVRPNAKGYMALCPAHPDRHHSLSIAPGRSPSYVQLHCFRGCRRPEILDALGMQDDAALVYVAPPVDEMEQAHRISMQMASQRGWLEPDSVELRRWRQRIADLHAAAERLGPDDPAAWMMVTEASALDHEFRLLDVATDPTA